MKFTYYPGCSLHSTAEEYDSSTQTVFRELGIELEELKDWNCCGASSAHSLNGYLSHALPLRNLILAEKQGNDVLVACASCYNQMRNADHYIQSQTEDAMSLNREMEGIMGASYKGTLAIKHLVDVATQDGIVGTVKQKVSHPLAGLKVAAYYGCLLTRPPKVVAFDANPEQPQKMDRLLGTIGAESVRWTHKTECCGASLSISQPELVVNLTKKIVDAARRGGAEAIVTACPLCQANLDTRQETGTHPMPVFFITELIGIAIGSRSDHWLKKHIIDPVPLLRSLNLLPAS
ncbi:MAG: CoB--CoM heterodisulfide reductase iron-sulfur subunit B family protein [Bacillota bacterium]